MTDPSLGGPELRRTEQGHFIDATLLRSFLRAALDHDAVADDVRDLLFAHVVERRYHPSVVAASLRPIILDVLDAATAADWQQVADELAGDAQAVLEESRPKTPPSHRRDRRSGTDSR